MHHLSCKIIRQEGDKVEIEIEGQIIKISSSYLPEDLVAKETFQLFFINSKNNHPTDKNLAKAILEEILNGK